jgi:hypothetical protein
LCSTVLVHSLCLVLNAAKDLTLVHSCSCGYESVAYLPHSADRRRSQVSLRQLQAATCKQVISQQKWSTAPNTCDATMQQTRDQQPKQPSPTTTATITLTEYKLASVRAPNVRCVQCACPASTVKRAVKSVEDTLVRLVRWYWYNWYWYDCVRI